MHSRLFTPAQTHIALLNQLHQKGYETEELQKVQETYRLCMRIFNGRYRKNERPFICHAVGAGSAMAEFDGRPALVKASMLHAAYDSGVFPDAKTGSPSLSHRALVREIVGEETEQLVADYPTIEFEEGSPEALAQMEIPDCQRDIMLMKVAHEIDDIASGGIFFCSKFGPEHQTRLEACRAIATALENTKLADAFTAYIGEINQFEWVSTIARDPKSFGYRLAPNWKTYLRLRRHARKGKHVRIV